MSFSFSSISVLKHICILGILPPLLADLTILLHVLQGKVFLSAGTVFTWEVASR